MADEGQTAKSAPMVVRRRFKMQDGVGLRWAEPNEVVETAGWRNAPALERNGYLRKLEHGETWTRKGNRLEVAKGAGAQITGGERASSTQKTDPVAPAPSSPDPEDEAEEEEAETPELVHVGGGWYNVELGGTPHNKQPIQGKAAAQDYADDL